MGSLTFHVPGMIKEDFPQVFKAIKVLLSKLEKFSEDPEAAAQQEKEEG